MVQNINWNSYSANQIMEMKQKGVQVPDDVLKKAESSIPANEAKEVTAESKDDTQVEYEVKDDFDASEESPKTEEDNTAKNTGIQTAEDFKKQLEQEGASLKSMVKQFTEKANENTENFTASLEELSTFTDFIAEKQDVATEAKAEAEKEQAEVQETVEEMTQEINKKQDEIETINDKVETGEATEEEQAKAEDLQAEVKTIASDGNATVSAKEAVVTDLNTKTENTMSDLEALTKLVNEGATEAQKGVDFAKETYDLSNKLYKKGAKAGKIGTIASSAVGAAMGGIGMNSIKVVHNDVGLTNTLVKSSIGLNIGGAVSGASVLGSIGSLFGSKNRKIGQAGMDAANKLSQVATNQINTAKTIANNNGIAIGSTTEASSAVADLSDTVKDAETTSATDIKDETKTDNKALDIADNAVPAESPTQTDEAKAEEEAKKKKEA